MNRHTSHVALSIMLFLLFASPALSQSDIDPGPADVAKSIYGLVSFTPDKLPDWDAVRSRFVPSANVYLRVARDSSHIFSLDEFVQDFVSFIENTPAKTRGFTENVVKTHSIVLGNIAQVMVLYEAQIIGSPRPPQQGVDIWQMVRTGGTWKVLSVTNEIPTPSRPVPELLRD